MGVRRLTDVSYFLMVSLLLSGCGGVSTPGSGATATAPAIATQPANQTGTVGQTATFSVTATGTAPLGYQWQKNGANISGATSFSYTTPATTSSENASTFQVGVSN